MSISFFVELANGTFVRKTREELLPEDKVVFDGPDAFRGNQEAQRRLDDEIAAAGGLDSWRSPREHAAS